MTLQLRTLGLVQLDAAGQSGAPLLAAQPKRLALLVYLALARPHGPQRRDTLLALLWPEASQEKGRQVLRQTVYLLRQALGAEAIVSRGDEDLGIDPGLLDCDALQFESAIY
jgi:DNA-binding SARP family transcriptional activator